MYSVFCMMHLLFCMVYFESLHCIGVFSILYGASGMVREKLDPCSIWGFPEAVSSLLGLTDEMARKVFCHFHFHFLHII